MLKLAVPSAGEALLGMLVGLVNTYLRGDGTTGTLTSPEFTIERKRIAFLIGGGAHRDGTCINLLVSGTVVRTAAGKNNERLDPTTLVDTNIRLFHALVIGDQLFFN